MGGFRVFKVKANSPAAEAGLEVFFDFVVEINGVAVGADQNAFFTMIKEAVNVRTKLVVYNTRSQAVRDVFIRPRAWGGAGLLGAVVRYDTLSNVDSQGFRVVEVFPNSPAQEAGFEANKDYLLGTHEVMFHDLGELVELLNMAQDSTIQLYVYNSESEAIREVSVAPRLGWGGDGVIGCDIRTGILHRIPAPRKPISIPSTAAAESQEEGLVSAQSMAIAEPKSEIRVQSDLSPLPSHADVVARYVASTGAAVISASARVQKSSSTPSSAGTPASTKTPTFTETLIEHPSHCPQISASVACEAAHIDPVQSNTGISGKAEVDQAADADADSQDSRSVNSPAIFHMEETGQMDEAKWSPKTSTSVRSIQDDDPFAKYPVPDGPLIRIDA